MNNIMKAESALLKRLEDDFGFKTIEAKYGGGFSPEASEVVF
jgi:hypothetical protein